MKILITGGTGFIGSRLALKCVARGDEVRVLGQENTPAEVENRKLLEANGAHVTVGSVTEKEKIAACLSGVDRVFHLAACQHEASVPDQKFRDVNVEGTRNMLEASVAACVKKFLHGSTIGVYGAPSGEQLDEQSVVRPDNIYGVTKLEGEKLMLSYQHKLPVVVVRISETYGPGDRRLVKLFRAIKKGVFFMIGRGTNWHHLIYIDDLIQGLLLAAEAEGAVGRVFVLSGKQPISTNEMVSIIAKELGASIPRWHAPLWVFLAVATVLEATLRPFGIQPPLHRRRMDFFRKSFLFSQERSSTVLGFQPQISFEAGVKETAAWYKQMGYI